MPATAVRSLRVPLRHDPDVLGVLACACDRAPPARALSRHDRVAHGRHPRIGPGGCVMATALDCGHEDAQWHLDGEYLCTGCLLLLLLAMDAEDELLGDLATEVLQ